MKMSVSYIMACYEFFFVVERRDDRMGWGWKVNKMNLVSEKKFLKGLRSKLFKYFKR